MMPANETTATNAPHWVREHAGVASPQDDANDGRVRFAPPSGVNHEPMFEGAPANSIARDADTGFQSNDGQENSQHHTHGKDLRERIAVSTHAGVKQKHLRAITVLGRIGWCAKGIVYGLIGGLCVRGAISEKLQDTSPQGAFVLLGKGVGGVYVLIIMAVALATYIIWRFWEGVTAQGSHPCYSKFKNFFTFRLSPLVSGGVYCAYLAYILYLIPKAFDYKDEAVEKTSGSDFTASWRNSGFGKFGLFIVGLAFLIACIIMLLQVLTKKFHRELRLKELRCWAKWLVLVAGHMGALGRAALFMGVAILMFRAMGDKGPNDKKQNTVSKALNQLVGSQGGRAVLGIIGILLVIYCLFAMLNAYPAKIFPTPLPSEAEQKHMIERRKGLKLARGDRKKTRGDRLDILRNNFVEVVDLPGDYGRRHGINSSATSQGPTIASRETPLNGSKHSATVVPTGGSDSVTSPRQGPGNDSNV